MGRLRYSLVEAEEEVKRLATEYVTNMDLWPGAVLNRVAPSALSPKSPSTKHPINWVATFDMPWPKGVVVDGGELMFYVNIETKEVRQFDFG